MLIIFLPEKLDPRAGVWPWDALRSRSCPSCPLQHPTLRRQGDLLDKPVTSSLGPGWPCLPTPPLPRDPLTCLNVASTRLAGNMFLGRESVIEEFQSQARRAFLALATKAFHDPGPLPCGLPSSHHQPLSCPALKAPTPSVCNPLSMWHTFPASSPSSTLFLLPGMPFQLL